MRVRARSPWKLTPSPKWLVLGPPRFGHVSFYLRELGNYCRPVFIFIFFGLALFPRNKAAKMNHRASRSAWENALGWLCVLQLEMTLLPAYQTSHNRALVSDVLFCCVLN